MGAADTARIVVVALGGIPTRLPVERWPVLADTHWLVPAAWNVEAPRHERLRTAGWPFADMLRSVDAVVTKPGYGTFAEAACNGTAVLYQRREDWPEQDCLIEWLHANGRAREMSEARDCGAATSAPRWTKCWRAPYRQRRALAAPMQAARHLAGLLK